MTIKFYSTLSEKNRIEKVLTNETIITGTLKENTDLLYPSIMMEADLRYFLAKNYAYIVEFGRYYFIKNIDIKGNNLVEIKFEIDVLMTYKDSILQLFGHVAEYEKTNDSTKLDTIESYVTEKIEYENKFDKNGSLIMVCVNGKRE